MTPIDQISTSLQLLQHPWITLGDEKLAAKDLTGSITVMRKFNARRRLKAAADAVIMANRMKNLFGKLKSAATEIEAQKNMSLLDAEAIKAADSINLSDGDNRRPSFDANLLDESTKSNPAQDLLNDASLN